MRPLRVLIAFVLSALIGSLLVHAADPAAAAISPKGRGIASRVSDLSGPGATDHLKNAGAGWTYAWRYRNIPDSTPELDVVPMLRSEASILPPNGPDPGAIATLTAKKQSGAFKYLLGFNEPDNAHQANMTPAKAAQLWPQLQQTGLILGSPAVAHPDNGWLKSFMTLAKQKSLQVNFIALHYYVNVTDTPATAAARIKKSLIAVHTAYGKPIWVTELGITDSRTTNIGTPATNWVKAANIMRAVTTMLDSQSSYVQRYAWVADYTNDYASLKWSGLYTAPGSGVLTALGRVYKSLGQ